MNEPDHPPRVDPNDRHAAILLLGAVPKPRAVAFAVRCAGRVAPRVLDAHPDALERLNAVEAVLRVVGEWARGRAVSRFTLRLVRDVAYDVADVCDAAGPTLYAAAAANDADPTRSAASALREALRLGGEQVRQLIERDFAALTSGDEFGPLWPAGEPDGCRSAWETLHAERPRLVRLFELPAG